MRKPIIGAGLAAIVLIAVGCGGKDSGDDTAVETDTSVQDTGEAPQPEEICDGEDNDGDGRVDEKFPDTDADGVADCVDEEECDGLDNDGDGDIDEGFDHDTDGIPDCEEVEECNGLDDDADGEIDEDFDLDGDGYTTCDTFPDCDDEDASTSPGGTELDGDLKDNDCDGLVDETTWRPGDLVITEVMIAPVAVEDIRGEWVEVANTTDRTVVLNGLRLFSSGGNHLIMRGDWVSIEAGGLAVLGLSMNPSLNGGVPVDYAYSTINLNPVADTLTIAIEGLTLDSVSWGEAPVSPEGATLSLDPDRQDAIENDLPDSWCASEVAWGEGTDMGTPGLPNDLCGQMDHDGDGFSGDAGDCDDSDPDVYPGAPEIDVGVDNDCDGEVASQPVAWADYDVDESSLSSCDVLQLDGSRSYDPDGAALSYSWTLADKPEVSSADTSWISSPSDERPTFAPDQPGDYQFSLTVSDGTLTSLESRLTLTLMAPDMSALDAGPDQRQDITTSCTATRCDECPAVVFSLETDAADLPAVYDFYWTPPEDWSSVGIDDPSSSTPYVVVWGITPEPGETLEQVIEVSLKATDCLESETVDTVALTVSCTAD